MTIFGHTRTFKDSGNLVLKNTSAIAISGVFVFDVDERFKPYEDITIINNSDEEIGLSHNYKMDFQEVIPAGTTRTLNLVAEDIRIKNNGSAEISINSITLNLRHSGEREKKKINDGLQTLSQIAIIKNFF